MITKIKKIIFKKSYFKRLNKISEKKLRKLYDIYDYVYLDDELELISKELRVRIVNNMLKNDVEEFKKHFGDFSTADMWINEPWFIG